jgi:hypothetical protein
MCRTTRADVNIHLDDLALRRNDGTSKRQPTPSFSTEISTELTKDHALSNRQTVHTRATFEYCYQATLHKEGKQVSRRMTHQVTIPEPSSLVLTTQATESCLTQPFKPTHAPKIGSSSAATQPQYHLSISNPLGTLTVAASSKQVRLLSIPLTISRQGIIPPPTSNNNNNNPPQLQCAITAKWHITRSIRSQTPSFRSTASAAPAAMVTKESVVKHCSVLVLPPFYCDDDNTAPNPQQNRVTANLEVMLPATAATPSIDLPSLLRVEYSLALCVELLGESCISDVKSAAGGRESGVKCLGTAELKIPVEIS